MATLRSLFFWSLLVLLFAAPARADLTTVLPDDWFTRPPTPEKIKAVQEAVAVGGVWGPVAERIYAGSLHAYELHKEDAAVSWYYLARWCELLGKSQKTLGRQWLEAVHRAGTLHRGISQDKALALPDEPLARLISEDTGAWLLGDREFSETFFDLIGPYDYIPGVMDILETLRLADPVRMADYRQLALAIALVYDMPPPPQWPHWQVPVEVLPRRLPRPLDAFNFFIDSDKDGRTLHKLGTVDAAELKFMVDLAAPFSELVWAQKSVKFPLGDLVKSYQSIRYRQDRIQAEVYVWPGAQYDLTLIYKEGGICVDQAYFATQTGKARGVPTLLFSGAGRDGRHAWFGYLGAGKKWVLDAGRYAEQRYVTGVALDPQNWLLLSDHELAFLSEGFRRLMPYRQSQQNYLFAELYMRVDNRPAAAAAARKAVNYERRNVEAWNILLDATDNTKGTAREMLLREAATALQRYPDLNVRYLRALVASMRARGATAAADFEERSLVRRNQANGRSDIGIDQAVNQVNEAAPTDQVRVYRQLLQQYAATGGMDFYDRLTKPLVTKLLDERRYGEVKQVIGMTRAAFKPEFGSQFDQELTELNSRAK